MLNVSFWPDPWMFSVVEVTIEDCGIVSVESGDENPVGGNDAIQVGGSDLCGSSGKRWREVPQSVRRPIGLKGPRATEYKRKVRVGRNPYILTHVWDIGKLAYP